MAYVSPLAAYDAAVEQAIQDHYDRCEYTMLDGVDEIAIVDASTEIFEREVGAAEAVYSCAWAATTRAAIAYDRAAYERRHGTLDADSAARIDDVASARAELIGEAA